LKLDRRVFMKGLAAVGSAAFLQQKRLGASVSESVLALDPRRPQFHLLPPANWMNDPNAPIYWNGNYHMFYQYNPRGAVWGDMHWGHAISPDMVHWKHLPVALSPTAGTADAQGCFSGTAVIHNGEVAIIYTGVVTAPQNMATILDGEHSLRESQCLAISKDPLLRRWKKLPAPVIAAPPSGLKLSGFRDPSPWKSGNIWYMVIGSGTRKQGGVILLYRSDDLRKWEYLHFLCQGRSAAAPHANPVDAGDMWECPDFFPLGNKHVLIYSTQGKVVWQSGEFDTKELIFHPERVGVVDHGAFYAAKTQTDKSGNRILWGWIPETRPLEQYRAAGWAGMMSLPRVLTLSADGELQMTMVPSLTALRKQQQGFAATDSEQGRSLPGEMIIKNCCGEIICRVGDTSRPFALSLRHAGAIAGNAETWLSLRYDPLNSDQLELDGQKVSLTRKGDDPLVFHFYIDGSVIELLVNDSIAWTTRFYYPGNSAPDLRVHISEGWRGNTKLTLWQLAPISEDRLTT
jgi:beta-fructofuranosidase